jgi:hypothetical protein
MIFPDGLLGAQELRFLLELAMIPLLGVASPTFAAIMPSTAR